MNNDTTIFNLGVDADNLVKRRTDLRKHLAGVKKELHKDYAKLYSRGIDPHKCANVYDVLENGAEPIMIDEQ